MSILSEYKKQFPEGWLFLTTLDNPFHPARETTFWTQFDRDHGYHTDNLFARYWLSSPELSEAEQVDANNQAVKEIVDSDLTGLYIAVKEDTIIRPIVD